MSESETPRPEAEEQQTENGLQCFLDETRNCSANCMGYITDSDLIEQKTVLNNQQRNCILIVSVERLGRFLGAGVTMMSKDRADKNRSSTQPIPNPLGTK
jgi:hypothetical protein